MVNTFVYIILRGSRYAICCNLCVEKSGGGRKKHDGCPGYSSYITGSTGQHRHPNISLRKIIEKMTDHEHRCRVISRGYTISKTAQRHPSISCILSMTGTIQCTSTCC